MIQRPFPCQHLIAILAIPTAAADFVSVYLARLIGVKMLLRLEYCISLGKVV
jgi:hypothetical protein